MKSVYAFVGVNFLSVTVILSRTIGPISKKFQNKIYFNGKRKQAISIVDVLVMFDSKQFCLAPTLYLTSGKNTHVNCKNSEK